MARNSGPLTRSYPIVSSPSTNSAIRSARSGSGRSETSTTGSSMSPVRRTTWCSPEDRTWSAATRGARRGAAAPRSQGLDIEGPPQAQRGRQVVGGGALAAQLTEDPDITLDVGQGHMLERPRLGAPSVRLHRRPRKAGVQRSADRLERKLQVAVPVQQAVMSADVDPDRAVVRDCPRVSPRAEHPRLGARASHGPRPVVVRSLDRPHQIELFLMMRSCSPMSRSNRSDGADVPGDRSVGYQSLSGLSRDVLDRRAWSPRPTSHQVQAARSWYELLRGIASPHHPLAGGCCCRQAPARASTCPT